MENWEREEKAKKEAAEIEQMSSSLAGCFGPLIWIMVILAIIGHFVSKTGDAFYYPLAQNSFFSIERSVENTLRDTFGVKLIIPRRDSFTGLRTGSSKYRMIASTYKVADKYYVAHCSVTDELFEKWPKQLETLLLRWKNNPSLVENVEKLQLVTYFFSITLLQKDFKWKGDNFIKYLFSNGRLTISDKFYRDLHSKDKSTRKRGQEDLAHFKKWFKPLKVSLPQGWENRAPKDIPEYKDLGSPELINYVLVPMIGIILVLLIIRWSK